ncbi:hypothetical protein [Labrys monachus]|uniref:Uncharacterized protein n=1 Tax=Labrys monachus TaxID=217067 RepID=A0ABU0FL22_9HYPH|nr:hypothetical protein [Labrys monachus]MDQ0395191.1 hypothetical protein [Labrys monachus]
MIVSHSELVELFYQSDRLDQRQLNWLRVRGVATQALIEPDPVLTARVAFDRAGTFDIVTNEEEGARALLFLCYDTSGVAADITAWNPRTDRLALWLGAVVGPGEDEILRPRLGAPLPVYRDPLWWLRNDRRGIVVVDARKARGKLAGIAMQAEDAVHAAELRCMLTTPSPRITWQAKAGAAA